MLAHLTHSPYCSTGPALPLSYSSCSHWRAAVRLTGGAFLGALLLALVWHYVPRQLPHGLTPPF